MNRNDRRQLAKARQARDLLLSIVPPSEPLEAAQIASQRLVEALQEKPTAAQRRNKT